MTKTNKAIDLKGLSKSQLQVMASDIRSDILTSVNLHGGHLSSNLGAVELTMSLVSHFDPLENDILFDVGHQTYTYKILTGRNLHDLRQTGGLSPFSSREESPYDKYNNGHAGTSLSTAYGIARAKALKGDMSYTIAVIGDSSIMTGLSMEALNDISEDHRTHLIIVVNDNGMSISRHVGHIESRFQKLRNSRFYFRTSSHLGKSASKHKFTWRIFLKMRSLKDHMRRFFIHPTMFEGMGLKYIGPIDGHDFDALDLGFQKALAYSDKNGPVVVHVLTKKGYGYKEAMEDETGKYHGVKADFDTVGKSSDNPDDFIVYKKNWLLENMAKDDSLYVITPAMERGSGLSEVFEKFPDRAHDVGICEEHAVTFAGGLALKGMTPIVDIYSTFLQRSYDEVLEDISRERVKSYFFIERAGIVGEDGESHHGLYDVSMLRSIPYSHCYMPYDRLSFDACLEKASTIPLGPVCIRFSKDKPVMGISQSPDSFLLTSLGKEESDVLLLAIGPKGYELSKPYQDRYDVRMLADLLPEDSLLESLCPERKKALVLLDPYGIRNGTASQIADYLARRHLALAYLSYTLENDFVTFGQTDDLYRLSGFDAETLRIKLSRFLDANGIKDE